MTGSLGLNCFMFDTIPTCSVYSVNGVSGDIQGKILPKNLTSECANMCTTQPEAGMGLVPYPQYVPGCGTVSGSIDIMSYGILEGIGVVQDSCRSVSPPAPAPVSCTSSYSEPPSPFQTSGVCNLVQGSVGSKPYSYYECTPRATCVQSIPSEPAGICIRR
jgi:hypothetical protein